MNTSLIVGLGKTGTSCVHYLLKKKKHLIVFDTRQDPPGLEEFRKKFPTIPVYLQQFDLNLLGKIDEIIVSPGVSLQESFLVTAQQKNIPVIGDIELFARAAKAPIVAITGTNAKGTVTTLVGEMIKEAGYKVIVGGNIGIPALDLLSEPTPDFYVLELSSFQLESTFSLQAIAATILNISEDHLDRHKTMEAYLAAKQRIYLNCHSAIWNRDNKWTYPSASLNSDIRDTPQTDKSLTISFGLAEPLKNDFGLHEHENKVWLSLGDQKLLSVDNLLIKGKHNWCNALAALALGHAINLPFPSMLTALKTFKGLEHRCEWVAEINGVTWYNDSKGTNVGATIAAIEGLSKANGKIILIAGGIGKGADFSVLRQPIKNYVKTVILIGQDAPLLERSLKDTAVMEHAQSLQDAVLIAKNTAQPQDIVLLSPACASFDMFNNYEHRGQVFKSLVREFVL